MSNFRCRWCRERLDTSSVYSREDLKKENGFRNRMTCPSCGRELDIDDESDVEEF